MDLFTIFLTGLTVGGLTCLAVQGGLLASVIAARESAEVKGRVNSKNPFFPTLAFLLAKLISYTIFGALLGLVGGAISISESVQIAMQVVAGLYMIAIALNLLDVHPIFRYVVIQPPRFLLRKVKHQSKSEAAFAPAMLGMMTIFIPCGTTLAMEALAIASASPFQGAAIMAAFVAGTSPLFFGVGWLTSTLGDNYRTRFLTVAAVAVLYLGLASINGALTAAASPYTFQNMMRSLTGAALTQDATVKQEVRITISSGGYSPGYFKVRKDVPVTVTLDAQDAYTCASAFRIPTLGISRNLQPNEQFAFTFTPRTTGQIPFTCSMGMYTGIIEVI